MKEKIKLGKKVMGFEPVKNWIWNCSVKNDEPVIDKVYTVIEIQFWKCICEAVHNSMGKEFEASYNAWTMEPCRQRV